MSYNKSRKLGIGPKQMHMCKLFYIQLDKILNKSVKQFTHNYSAEY